LTRKCHSWKDCCYPWSWSELISDNSESSPRPTASHWVASTSPRRLGHLARAGFFLGWVPKTLLVFLLFSFASLIHGIPDPRVSSGLTVCLFQSQPPHYSRSCKQMIYQRSCKCYIHNEHKTITMIWYTWQKKTSKNMYKLWKNTCRYIYIYICIYVYICIHIYVHT